MTDSSSRSHPRSHQLSPPSADHNYPFDQSIVDSGNAGPSDRDRSGASDPIGAPIEQHSGPIPAMPQRDFLALKDYFDRRDMVAISADMNTALANVWPPPVWDDDIWADVPVDAAPNPVRSPSPDRRGQRDAHDR